MQLIDEERLETDYLYRCRYLASVIDFTERDITALKKHKEFIAKSLAGGIHQAMAISLNFDVSRKYLMSRMDNVEYLEPIISDIEDLTVESEVVKKRMEKFTYGMCYIFSCDWTDKDVNIMYASHSPGWGNKEVEIDMIHTLHTFGNVLNWMVKEIMSSDIDKEEQAQLIVASSKILTIRNDLTYHSSQK